MKFRVRKACLMDSNLIYLLNNEKTSRKNSINSKIINKKEHKIWFKKKINNKKNFFFIIKSQNLENIGIVRYDFENILGYVSINIQKKFRNLGYGTKILKKTEKLIKKNVVLVAFVKKNNTSSEKIFIKNKYKILKNGKLLIFYKKIKK